MIPKRNNTYSTGNSQYSVFRFKDLITFFWAIFVPKKTRWKHSWQTPGSEISSPFSLWIRWGSQESSLQKELILKKLSSAALGKDVWISKKHFSPSPQHQLTLYLNLQNKTSKEWEDMQFAGNDIWSLRWSRLVKHEPTKHSNWDGGKMSLHILYFQCLWNTKEVTLLSQALAGFSVQGKFSSLVCAVPGAALQAQNITSGTDKSDVTVSHCGEQTPTLSSFIPSLKGTKHPQALSK